VQKRLVAIGVLVLCLAACHEALNGKGSAAAIVGAWVVKIPDAPFPLQMFVFHSDGTVEQSNPDSGDPNTSDSNLMGGWRWAGDEYQGNLVEITADRVSHKFASRGQISFELKVTGNAFAGTARATFFDASGRRIKGPIRVGMKGNGCSHDHDCVRS
jgi:hypothetical protein